MKKSRKISNSFVISVAYIRHLLQIGADWGVSEQELLRGCGLSHSELQQPDARITTREAGLITRRLIQLSGRNDIGMEYGMLIRPTSHGFLGYAVMSCATLAEAMQVLHKYHSLHFNDFTQTVEVRDKEVVITLTESYDFGPMRQVFFEAFLVSTCQHMAYLIGRELAGLKVHVDWSRPAYFDAYQARLPLWEFKQAHIQIRFPRSFLSLPLIMADPHAVRHALAQVEKEAAARAMADSPDIVPRVRAVLQTGIDGYPSLADVADKLCVSERTLKRKLSESGSNFQSLLDDARRRQAMELINAGQLRLQQIAQVLGYTDPAAFTRAFKRWTGERPSDVRKGRLT
ncbi:AraC family transcriptional regulator [Pseudomonas chlororaphis]|uniref:AraC family transcriptional regulator n=1 Tax=Pseudomonas chlororaphis TaxID=587753 RepID=UPI00240820DC|nr:AraC family transcriptional regulator [Pseudomonas chlororaphis]